MNTFYKNYVSLCASKKKSLSAVAQEIGLSRTSPNGWKKGKVPSTVTLEKLSQYFGVPVDELTSDNKKEPTPCRDELSEYDMKVLAWFRALPEEKRQAILTIGDAPKDLTADQDC